MAGSARYPYRAITDHPPFLWPGGARVAVWVIPNVEHHPFDRPSVSVNDKASATPPDVLNHSWRDYGPRVGIWRLFDCLAGLGITASATLNSDVCDEYPQVVTEGTRLGWEWLGHGTDNSRRLSGLGEEDERALVETSLGRIAAATGQRPRGWLGPGLAETARTPEILHAAGVEYVCDWVADDLPFTLRVEGGEILSLPYSIELNDMELILRQRLTGPEYRQRLIDQFEQLNAEAGAQRTGRVMAIPLHPFLAGQAHRVRYLREALEHIALHKGSWLARGGEIADYYLRS
ncbi:MAG TPA: polysaccharide deacetylase family protein [Trebonia sp.]|jgi:allantoinase|nr:polysaccharide deacetylase family protein [Trebonia sp.]